MFKTPKAGGKKDQRLMAEAGSVFAASVVLTGISAASLAAVGVVLTAAQFRALLVVAGRGPMHLCALAHVLGVHPSHATRLCDRLVTVGFVDRRDNPADRLHLLLTVTPAGQQLVDSVIDRRVASIAAMLRRMSAPDRTELARLMSAFAAAAGEPEPTAAWSVAGTVADRG